MTMTVHAFSGSPFAWRVLLALEYKRLPYQVRYLSVDRREHLEDWFRALSPRGRVPVLEADGIVVHESMAILLWLDARHPQPSLLGAGDAARARVLARLMELATYLDERVLQVIRPLFFGSPEPGDPRLARAARHVSTELDRAEGWLGEGPWLAGDAPSAVDLALYPLLRVLERASGKPAARALAAPIAPFTDQRPRLASWAGRVESLPGFERTWPPHWRAGD